MQVLLLVEEHSKAELNIGYPGLFFGVRCCLGFCLVHGHREQSI